jgi:hypothetical protein
MYSISCYKERLNFENTLYIYCTFIVIFQLDFSNIKSVSLIGFKFHNDKGSTNKAGSWCSLSFDVEGLFSKLKSAFKSCCVSSPSSSLLSSSASSSTLSSLSLSELYSEWLPSSRSTCSGSISVGKTSAAEMLFSNVKSENDISITQFRDESMRLHHM